MAIKKQEFYEGAALHILARSGKITHLHYKPPLFFINKSISLMLKYSTRNRSPWGFTFTPLEQSVLKETAASRRTIIGLICGSDGVASLTYPSFQAIANHRNISLHLSCCRTHGKHYEIAGPEGTLNHKVPPGGWQQVLDEEEQGL